MNSAIARAIAGEFESKSYIYTPSFFSAQKLADEIGATAIKNLKEFPHCDIYFLGMKPQQLSDFSELTKSLLNEKSIIISMLAGVSTNTIHRSLGIEKIVRVMPNTPSLIGQGVLTTYFSKSLLDNQKKVIESLLSSCGDVFVFATEDEIDKTTCVTGSGPAYFFEFCRILEGYLVEQGISQKSSNLMVKQLFMGSAMLSNINDEGFEQLRNNVTSKKGVTFEALESFKESGLEEITNKALASAYKRTKELSL